MKTARGIYLSLKESDYIYNYKGFTFYFSSNNVMQKFIQNVENFINYENQRINVKYILYYDIEHSRVIYPDWSYTIACDNNSENQYRLGNISDIDVHMKCQNYNENLGKIIGYGVEDNGDFYEYETTFDKIIDGENTNNSIPLVILDNTHNKTNPYTIYKAIMLGLDTI